MFIRILRAFSLVLLSGIAGIHAGCSRAPSHTPPTPAPAIETLLRSTSGLDAGPLLKLQIHRDALEREFYLWGGSASGRSELTGTSPSDIDFAGAFSFFAPRIVTFSLRGDRIALKQSPIGLVHDHIGAEEISIAVFAVEKIQDDWITIDFNAGMQTPMLAPAMITPPSHAPRLEAEAQEAVTPLSQSYLADIQLIDSKVLRIHQAARTAQKPIQIIYHFEPYSPDENFVPTEPYDSRHAGFFQTYPRLERNTGRPYAHVIRWNIDSSPVRLAISANTPQEWRETIRKGGHYWNTIFGREVVQIIDAPADSLPLDPRYNLIQWMDTRTDGSYAYGDITYDPRTGQANHALLFLTAYTPAEANRLARRLRRIGGARDERAPPRELIENYLSYTVTHEIGHILGLRHNFAGSTDSTLQYADTDQAIMQWLAEGEAPRFSEQARVSSSIMDNMSFNDRILHMMLFEQNGQVGEHDRLAIRQLYRLDNSSADEHWPSFCTDAERGSNAACSALDIGNNPIQFAQQHLARQIRLMPELLMDQLLQRAHPAPQYFGVAAPLGSFTPRASDSFALALGFYDPALQAASESQVQEAGGWAKILFVELFPTQTASDAVIPPSLNASTLTNRFREVSGDTSAALERIGSNYFAAAIEHLQRTLLEKAQKVDLDHDSGHPDFEPTVEKVVRGLLFSETGSTELLMQAAQTMKHREDADPRGAGSLDDRFYDARMRLLNDYQAYYERQERLDETRCLILRTLGGSCRSR